MRVRVLFVREFPSGTKTHTVAEKDFTDIQLTKNFKLSELANNKAGDPVKAIWNNEVEEHCIMLQELRDIMGQPLKVNSWYRTESFNKKCGGSSNSLHLKGLATDLSFPKMSDGIYNMIKGNWKSICEKHQKIGGINRYTNGVHLSSHEEIFGNKFFVERNYVKKNGDW